MKDDGFSFQTSVQFKWSIQYFSFSLILSLFVSFLSSILSLLLSIHELPYCFLSHILCSSPSAEALSSLSAQTVSSSEQILFYFLFIQHMQNNISTSTILLIYTPGTKNTRDVKHCLHLFKVTTTELHGYIPATAFDLPYSLH